MISGLQLLDGLGCSAPMSSAQITVMSAPFASPPSLPVGAPDAAADDIAAALLALPRPRKHYQHYYSTRSANQDMMTAPAGLHAFHAGILPYEERRLGWKLTAQFGRLDSQFNRRDAHVLRDGCGPYHAGGRRQRHAR